MDTPNLPVEEAPAPGREACPALIIDTQVVMDWLVFRDARVQHVANAVMSRAVRWLVTPAMRDEIRHVLGRGVAAAYAPDLGFIEAHFDGSGVCVEAAPQQPLAGRLVCRDPDDQKFIDLALASRARWLVSRDKAVLALAKRARARELAILTPERWSLS